MITDARTTIDRKNKKLKELIEYIKKLHMLLAHLSASEEDLTEAESLARNAHQIPGNNHDGAGTNTNWSIEDVEEIVLPLEAKINKDQITATFLPLKKCLTTTAADKSLPVSALHAAD